MFFSFTKSHTDSKFSNDSFCTFRAPNTLKGINKYMNKFDSIISDLREANGYPNQQQNTATNNNQQQNNNTNQQQQNTSTNQQQNTNTATNNNQQQQSTNQQQQQQQKIDLQKLMTDFNNNTLSINNIKDFEKYGLKAS